MRPPILRAARHRRTKRRSLRPRTLLKLFCIGTAAFLGGLYTAYVWSLLEQGGAAQGTQDVGGRDQGGGEPPAARAPSPSRPRGPSATRAAVNTSKSRFLREDAPNSIHKPPEPQLSAGSDAPGQAPRPSGAPSAPAAASDKAVQRGSNSEPGGAEERATVQAPWVLPGLVVIAYNRPHYLRRTLQSLSGLRGLEEVEVMVSQDGDQGNVAAAAAESAALFSRGAARGYTHWSRPRVPDPRSARGALQPGTAWLAQHYGYALDRAFAREPNRSHVVVVEDDMEFSPDFIRFMRHTAPLLDADPTLMCVSSWNDNGFRHLDLDPASLFRTSYFPGLGWMLTRRLWEELRLRWPLDHWDHWMRSDDVHKGRDCVAPEVSRNRNIGESGVNVSPQAFRATLAGIASNDDPDVALGSMDYLHRDRWDAATREALRTAMPWGDLPFTPDAVRRVAEAAGRGSAVLVPFRHATFRRLARALRIHDVPRAHYHYVLRIRTQGVLFLLAHAALSPLLPPELRVKPPEGFVHVAARQGMSCVQACGLASGLEPERDVERQRAGLWSPPLLRIVEGTAEARLRGRGTARLRCVSEHFEEVNTCSALHRAFPCDAGCAMVLGPDVPNFVADARNVEHYGQCLFTEKESLCAAKQWSTARLCPCAPS